MARHLELAEGRKRSAVRIGSRLKIIGVNPYVFVRAEEASRLKSGWRRPMPVRFHINGSDKVWRVNLMPVGDGSFRLFLNGEIRSASGLRVGDPLKVEVEFDDAYASGPQHPMPKWFGDELTRSRTARRSWDLLTPSLQKEVLRYFARLKSPEAKRSNVRRALRVLRGEKERFLGRLWND